MSFFEIIHSYSPGFLICICYLLTLPFLQSLFIYAQVTLEYLRHLVIIILFLFVCMYDIHFEKQNDVTDTITKHF